MAIQKVNYCSNCLRETPDLTKCPFCKQRLKKKDAGYSFTMDVKQSTDWYCWRRCLLALLPPVAAVMVITLLAELLSGGFALVGQMISDGFFLLYVLILCVIVLGIWLVLDLRGTAIEHNLLNDQMLIQHIAVRENDSKKLLLWLHTQATAAKLQEKQHITLPQTFALVRSRKIPLSKIKRIRLLSDSKIVLMYSSKWRLVLTLHCKAEDWNELEAYINKITRKKAIEVIR